MLAKGKLKILGATLMTVFTLGGTVFGSFAWFVATKENPAYKINGRSAGAYFAYGNGTREKPYGISVPRHLYNLSWLHYMGQFDDNQYYFELANSVPSDGLNMENYVIPPIGTEDKPFVGNINGNNKIIKN